MDIKEKLNSQEFKDFLNKKISTLKKIKFIFSNSILTGGAFTSFCLEYLYQEKIKIKDYDMFICQTDLKKEDVDEIRRYDKSLYNEIFHSSKSNVGNDIYVVEDEKYQIVDAFENKKINYIFFTKEESFSINNLLSSFDLNCIRGAYDIENEILFLPKDFLKFLKTKEIKFSFKVDSLRHNLLSYNEDNKFYSYERSERYIANLIRAIDKKNNCGWKFNDSFYLEELRFFTLVNSIESFNLEKDLQAYYSCEGEESNLHCFVSKKIKSQFLNQNEWKKYFNIKDNNILIAKKDKENIYLRKIKEIKEYISNNKEHKFSLNNLNKFFYFLSLNYFYKTKDLEKTLENLIFFTKDDNLEDLVNLKALYAESYFDRDDLDYLELEDYNLDLLKEIMNIAKEIKKDYTSSFCLKSKEFDFILTSYIFRKENDEFNKLSSDEIEDLSHEEYRSYFTYVRKLDKKTYLSFLLKVKEIILKKSKYSDSLPYSQYLADTVSLINDKKAYCIQNIYDKYKENINTYLQNETNLIKYNSLDLSDFESFFEKVVSFNKIKRDNTKKSEFLIKCLF